MKCLLRSSLLGLCFGLSALPPTLFAAEKAVLQGRIASSQPVAFDIYIPIQKRDELEKDLYQMQNPDSPTYHKWLTPATFHARYGASDGDITAIKQELSALGLEATIVNGHRIHVTGSSSLVERALGTSLQNGTFKSGRSVAVSTNAMTTPGSMQKVGAVVVGLEGTMMMRTHAHAAPLPENRYATYGGYWFDDLKQAYDYPSYKIGIGKGTTIATVSDGAYLKSDMTAYFAHEKIAVPSISEINVAGGSPVNSDSFETNLDLQQAGGMAPGAKLIHYNLPDLSNNSIIDGLSEIITDNKADIVSMSFGEAELFYTKEFNGGIDFTYLPKIMDDIFAQGNAQGISFFASSGDSGALAAVPLVCFEGGPNCGTAIASVNFPASSPHVTGVGGTNLKTTYDGITKNSGYVSEEAFADPLAEDIFYGTSAVGSYFGSGGGDSILFKKPFYQAYVETGNKTHRTVPDVALHMGGCPNGAASCSENDSFDYEVFGGSYYGAIGTSAAAPDLAGLAALAVELERQRLGNQNFLIYTIAYLQNHGVDTKAFHKGIPGFNGKYFTSAAPYNRVLGNGTVSGVDVLLEPWAAKAGVPQTPSNP